MTIVRKEGNKVYIEGVRRISWATGEMCEFALALTVSMECMGEDIPYHFVMGASGVAFRFVLFPDRWEESNYYIIHLAADKYEPIRRAFEAVGYEFTIFERSSEEDDLARIMASIDRGIPIIAFGVVGPSDCSIITGYDDGGEVLLGWSTYQDIPHDHNIPHDPTGYFRKPNWHENTRGFILIGSKVERPPLRQIYIDALKWAVKVVRTPKVIDRDTGLEAYKIWANEMTQEKYFPVGDMQVIFQRYLSTLCNLMMIDDHRSAVEFLRQVAEDERDLAPDLLAAADCYDEACKLKDDLNDLVRGDFSEEAQKRLADPEIRNKYARIILQIRDKEEEAISHIEHALERIDG